MSVNSSSSSDFHPSLILPLYMYCFRNKPGSYLFTSFFTTYILLLLPLCIFIIYHGLHLRRKNLSSSSAAPMSHSDSFTYNMVAMEMIGVSGCVLCCCGVFVQRHLLGYFLFSFTWFGETFFHVLTCVERYLAVVHPITYLSLRKQRGIRIRNISIGCVWMLCFVAMLLLMFQSAFVIFDFCVLISSLIVVSFCSVSVVCVLIGPGPGERGGARKRVDQSKKRAFYTIMVILGVLVVRFTWNLVWATVIMWGQSSACVIIGCGVWLNLPSALVLPLLFLLRTQRSVCCKKETTRIKVTSLNPSPK